jgi:hypothetical protein
MISVVNNFLSPEENILVHKEIISIPCTWAAADESRRHRFPMSKYWHFWNAHLLPEGLEKYPNIIKVRDKIKKQFFSEKEYEFNAIYINVQTVSNESPLHQDEGDLTFIYYSNPNWKIFWDGGTAFYNETRDDCIGTVSYKPGRLVLYDAKTPHKPLTISKYADDIRTILVFKCTEVK